MVEKTCPKIIRYPKGWPEKAAGIIDESRDAVRSRSKKSHHQNVIIDINKHTEQQLGMNLREEQEIF